MIIKPTTQMTNAITFTAVLIVAIKFLNCSSVIPNYPFVTTDQYPNIARITRVIKIIPLRSLTRTDGLSLSLRGLLGSELIERALIDSRDAIEMLLVAVYYPSQGIDGTEAGSFDSIWGLA